MLYNITTNIHPSVHFLSTDHHAQVFISLWNLWVFFIPSANKNRFAIPQKQTWFKFVQSLCCGNCSNSSTTADFLGLWENPRCHSMATTASTHPIIYLLTCSHLHSNCRHLLKKCMFLWYHSLHCLSSPAVNWESQVQKL